MTRSLSIATAVKAAMAAGTAPMVIVKIEWGGAIGTKYYADAAVTVGSIVASGRVVNADVNGIASNGSPGTVQEASVSLVDPDGTLRGYTNQVVMDGCAITIYHHYDGLGESDLLEILSGIVRGPVVWNDSDRTLAFQAERVLVDNVITYTPEYGEVADLPEESEGATWPLCFGTVIDVPAVRVSRGPRGTLKEAISSNNTTLKVTDGANFPQSESITLLIGGVYVTGEFGAGGDPEIFTPSEWNVPKYTNVIPGPRVADDDEENDNVFWLQDSTQEIIGLTLVVQSSTGMDSARQVNFVQAQKGNKIWCAYPWGVLLSNTGPGTFVANAVSHEQSPLVRTWFIKAGARVRQLNQADVFVANDEESTEVLRVQALQKQVDNKGVETQALLPVPSNFYTINLSDTVGGRTVTTITFDVPLSDRDPAWLDDTVYVSLRSSLSSNPAEVIEWALTERAGYAAEDLDSTAFALVETALTNYPAHFACLEPITISKLQEFAEQSRCALTWQNGLWHIRYLSAEPSLGDAATNLDDDWITEGRIEITATGRESSDRFATRIVGVYRDSYAKAPQRIMVENATAQGLYGVVETVIEFWGLQTSECVQKTLDFMIARRSRLWKLARIATQPNALAVEINDYVEIDVADLWPADLLGLVQSVDHDTGAHEIGLDIWLPIEEGTAVVSDSAYLDDSGDTPPDDPGDGIEEGDPQALKITLTFISGGRDGPEDESETGSVPGIVLSEVADPDYSVKLYPDGLDGAAGDTVTARAMDGAKPEADVEVMCSRVSGQWYLQYSGSAESTSKQFRVKSVYADLLVCRTWDGADEGGEDVLVAKPYLLRRSPFDGQTRDGISYAYTSHFERTATLDEETEDQVIVPSYVEDDLIYGISNIEGGTNVTNAEFLDINADGRAWALGDDS